MSSPAVVPFPKEPTRSSDDAAPEKEQASKNNPVNTAVRDLCALATASENIRADLAAIGVPRRVTNVLVELGVQKQTERLAETIDSALEQSEKAHGAGALDKTTLAARVVELVRIEEDTDHARQVARGQGLDPRSLAILSQLIQSNPGDGGTRAVNTLLAYATAAGISLDGVPQLSAELTAPPPSVLPQIPRGRSESGSFAPRRVLRDAIIGAAIGVAVIAILT